MADRSVAQRGSKALMFGTGLLTGALIFGSAPRIREDAPPSETSSPRVVAFTDLTSPPELTDDALNAVAVLDRTDAHEIATHLSADVEAAVLEWARRDCDVGDLLASGWLSEHDLVDAIEIQQVVADDANVFVVLESPCALPIRGERNAPRTVVVVQEGRVRPAVFERWPGDAPHRLAMEMGARSVLNPALGLHDDTVELVTVFLDTAFAIEATFAWQGRSFVPIELRAYEGGNFVPHTVGPSPIVWPLARRCAASFEREGRSSIALRTWAGSDTRSFALPLARTDCDVYAQAAVACGENRFDPDAEYALTSTDEHWAVLLLHDAPDADEVEVLRVPRACAL